jgi:hypothetical protein
MRIAIFLLATAACGSRSDSTDPGRDARGTGDSAVDAERIDDAAAIDDATSGDAPPAIADAAMPDAFPSKLDLHINCRNDCVLIANPASIAVPAGTQFTVNWINTGDTDCDVAKIDQFNQVPIIIGLEPGTSYYDSIRQWCGSFTGTFQFRVSICTIHSYIPVNCGA